MDQHITCCECAQVFVFNEAEQEFYASKDMKPPKRCKPCRRARRQAQGDRASRPSFPELRASSPELRTSSSGDASWADSASSGDLPPSPDSHTAPRVVGAALGPPKTRPASDSRPSRPSSPSRPRLDRPRYAITCRDCGAASEVPFRPVEGRQVYCQACYRAKKGNERLATDGLDVDEADLGIVES